MTNAARLAVTTGIIAGVLLTTVFAQQRNGAVWERALQEKPRFLDTLKELVSIESGSSDSAGLSRVADLIVLRDDPTVRIDAIRTVERVMANGVWVDVARYRTLLEQDSISRQQVDTQESLVRQYEAALQADQGNIDNAKLQPGEFRDLTPAELARKRAQREGLIAR